MNKINFTNKTNPPSGEPINATNLNLLQKNVEEELLDYLKIKSLNNTNLNEINETGIYQIKSENYTNIPVSDATKVHWGVLIVINFNNMAHQYLININNNLCYVRQKSGPTPTWKNWIRLSQLNG